MIGQQLRVAHHINRVNFSEHFFNILDEEGVINLLIMSGETHFKLSNFNN